MKRLLINIIAWICAIPTLGTIIFVVTLPFTLTLFGSNLLPEPDIEPACILQSTATTLKQDVNDAHFTLKKAVDPSKIRWSVSPQVIQPVTFVTSSTTPFEATLVLNPGLECAAALYTIVARYEEINYITKVYVEPFIVTPANQITISGLSFVTPTTTPTTYQAESLGAQISACLWYLVPDPTSPSSMENIDGIQIDNDDNNVNGILSVDWDVVRPKLLNDRNYAPRVVIHCFKNGYALSNEIIVSISLN